MFGSSGQHCMKYCTQKKKHVEGSVKFKAMGTSQCL